MVAPVLVWRKSFDSSDAGAVDIAKMPFVVVVVATLKWISGSRKLWMREMMRVVRVVRMCNGERNGDKS